MGETLVFLFTPTARKHPACTRQHSPYRPHEGGQQVQQEVATPNGSSDGMATRHDRDAVETPNHVEEYGVLTPKAVRTANLKAKLPAQHSTACPG